MLKNKRILLIVGAMVFVVVFFALKTSSEYRSQASLQANTISYDPNLTVKNLLSTDTDGDGVPDWEENLYGTDPTKPDTTPGIPDAVAIQKIQAANQASAISSVNTDSSLASPDGQPLTQTDKFSQELFSTVSALSQNGTVDDSTVNTISDSLVSQMKNTPARKIYALSDMNVISDNSLSAFKNYNNAMGIVVKGYPILNPADVLKSAMDENGNLDSSVLTQLDPYIQQTQSIISGMLKMKTPQDIADLQLATINALEAVSENLSDIELVDTDAVASLSAATQYPDNNTTLDTATLNLQKAVWAQLNSN